MRLGDVLGARGEDVEDEVPAGLEQLARGPQRQQLLVLARHVEERAERADHELHALVDRRLAHVADPEVDEVADAVLLGERARHREHPLREVDADHGSPACGDRNRDPARSDRELDDRPLAARVPPRRRTRCPRRPRRSTGRRSARWSRRGPRRASVGRSCPGKRVGTLGASWTPTHSSARDSQPQRRPRRRPRSRRVRVEYLGRKSAIKQALREVRDRETGMALNAVRERLEAAIDAREAELARAELDARLTTERVDVTLPGRWLQPRPAAPDHADPARGRGRLPRARLPGRRRPRGRDDALQLRRAQLPAGSPGALAARDAVRRRRDGAPHRDLAVPDPDDGGSSSRPSTSSRSAAPTGATRPTRRTRRSSTRSKASPSTRASRSPT